MAYYTALIAKLAVTGGTPAQQIVAINALTVPTGAPAKVILSPSAIINAIVPADLNALTTAQVTLLTLLLAGSSVDASSGTTVRAGVQFLFSGKATTLANLGALVAPFDAPTLPWWQATVAQGGGGLAGPVSQNDLDRIAAINTQLPIAQAKLTADQAALATAQAATPQVPADIAAAQAAIVIDNANIARLTA